MPRHYTSIFAFVATIATAGSVFSQTAAPPRVGYETSFGNSGLRTNATGTSKPVAMINKIIRPVPLTVDSQRNALKNLDRNISTQIEALAEKLKTALPDELTILTKTNGWKTEDQQALVSALRAGDRTAVYEAWVKGNPQDTAGAELAARQTDVNRLMTRLAQDADKNKSALKQDMAEFDVGLSKIAASTPAVSDLSGQVKTLKAWVEARKLIETATPGKGSFAKLPAGTDVTMVFDPTLPAGTAIVLSDSAIVIGQDGKSSLAITTGNAAEALGLPIVTGAPLSDAEGDEVLTGVLIVNPASSRGTINYNLNGNHYVAKSGMQQKLTETNSGRPWIIEFDQGEKFGPARFTLAAGTYYFTPTDRGWQIYRQRYEIVLDNSLDDQEFNYVFHGQNEIVPAGETRTLTSNYPIVIRFDRGNGSEFVAKTTSMTVGSLQIGVNANDNMWDLFPMTGNRREASKLQPFNADGAASAR